MLRDVVSAGRLQVKLADPHDIAMLKYKKHIAQCAIKSLR